VNRGARTVVVLVVAILAWVIAANWNLYPHQRLTDLPVYEAAADRIANGDLPYRDFGFEYPPLAATLIALVRIIPLSFSTSFSLVMLLALSATALGVMAAACALRLGPRREAAAGVAVALLPLLLGDFLATRLDLVLAALLAWTVWAAVTLRWRAAWPVLAAAVAFKLAPIVLVPLMVVWHRRYRGDRAATWGATATVAAAAATFVPFVALAPHGVWRMFSYHLDRPLQIESLGSAYLLGLHGLADIPLRVATSFGSQNLIGTGPSVIAALSTTVLVVGVIVVCIVVASQLRRAPEAGAARLLVAGFATTLVIVVGTAKVLSPQFLVWIVPAALLVTGPFGRLAFAMTVGVLLATQFYFPARYWDLVALEPGAIALLVIRDTLLVILVACTWPRRDYSPETLNPAIDVARPSEPASTIAP
jgi:Glycosyltransferase family 87